VFPVKYEKTYRSYEQVELVVDNLGVSCEVRTNVYILLTGWAL
jgi:hypothetical protein